MDDYVEELLELDQFQSFEASFKKKASLYDKTNKAAELDILKEEEKLLSMLNQLEALNKDINGVEDKINKESDFFMHFCDNAFGFLTSPNRESNHAYLAGVGEEYKGG